MNACSCGEASVVVCHTCSNSPCAEHLTSQRERCGRCGFGWLEEIADQAGALQAVTDRVAATGGPAGDGSTARLSWALVVAGRLGCSIADVDAAAAKGRVLRDRRRIRLLEEAAR